SHTLWLCNFFFFPLVNRCSSGRTYSHAAAPARRVLTVVVACASRRAPAPQSRLCAVLRPSSSPAPAVAPPRPSHASAPFFAYSAAPLPYRYCSAASCPSAAPLPHTQRAQIYLSDVGVLVTSYGIYRLAAAHYARFTARRHHRAQQLHRRRPPSPPARTPCAALLRLLALLAPHLLLLILPL
ncbi:hypothetical protein U1Q18_040638, partial [Sarracenia purpurea var. burkii]